MNIETYLDDLGLSQNEIKVYLCLLKNGQSLAGQVASKVGIHRRNVYDILERLIEKGYIGYIKTNNKKNFFAADPNKFVSDLKQKEQVLSEVMPELEVLYKNVQEKEETTFYKGKQGLKTIFEDELKEGTDEILIWGGSQLSHEVFPFYFKWYDKARVEKKIRVKIIAVDEFKFDVPLGEVKYLNKKYSNPMAINVYRDKVAIILWTGKPIGILIKNKEISDAYRKYFELMWKMSDKKISNK